MPKTVLKLEFKSPTGDAKAESKNYDIFAHAGNAPSDKKFPLLLSNKGDAYLMKGLAADPAKVKKVTIEVTVE